MVEYVTDTDETPVFHANLNDIVLCKLLNELRYKKQDMEGVLAIDLSQDLSYQLPKGFYINESKIGRAHV